MNDLHAVFEEDDGGVVLRVHAQPGAGRSAVVGRHGDAIKVKVAAPPVEGRANAAIATLLAETFGVRTDQVELRGGATSRSKRFRLDGVELDDAVAVLERELGAKPPGERRR
jgi:uncharacterized protein (TIGR00251 family)